MNRSSLTIVALLAFSGASVASAAVISSANPLSQTGSGSGGSGGGQRSGYVIDDGSSEDSIGWGQSGPGIAAINRFKLDPDCDTITAIEMSWGIAGFPGVSGLSGGESYDTYVIEDTDASGTPGPGDVSFYFGTSTVDGTKIDNNQFDSIKGSQVVTTPIFFLAVTTNAGWFPIGLDANTTGTGDGWTDGNSQGPWVPFNGDIGGPNPNSVYGVDGVWLVRGVCVPAPSALALVGLGGLAAIRRRR